MHAVIVCRDGGGGHAARASALSAHRDYVDKHADAIVLSGPLVGSDGVTRIGQLFVLDVPDLAEARRLVEEDPFTVAGAWGSIAIDGLIVVFRDGRRCDRP
jgi:uncharacterized protein YciI